MNLPPTTRHPAAGTRVGAFELRRCMGRGGSSEIWEAWHPASGTAVAVKLLCVGDTGTEGLAAALRSEARAVASLDHPHVVVVHDVGERLVALGDGPPVWEPWLAMELADGSLADRLDRPLSFDETWRTVAPLLSALAHAHARGLVHRDVKPSNVLHALREGQRVPVLADFGIAAQRSERRPRDEGFVVGTPGYMAPEQWTGAPREQGPWTDLYAMGCMIWRMLVGRAPFRADSLTEVSVAQLERDLPGLPCDVDVPAGFGEWLARLGARDPSRRYTHAAPALDDLRALVPVTHARRPSERPLVALPDSGLGLYRLRRSRLVGRDAELAELEAALVACARERRPRAYALRGAAGFGKTRVAEELAYRSAEKARATVLRASHGPSSVPGDGLRGALLRMLQAEGLRGSELAAQVRAWCGIALPRALAAGVEPLVTWLDPAAALGPEPLGYGAIRRIVGQLALDAPVLLVVDDAQWGADALQLVEHLLESMPSSPILCVLTVQDEALAERPVEQAHLARLAARRDVFERQIGPLSREATDALVEQLLPLDPTVRALVTERSEGNPLFALQLLGDWVDEDALHAGGRGFGVPPEVAVAWPTSLTAAWEHRIRHLMDRLDVREAWSLERAAVLGRTVTLAEWKAACAVDDLPLARLEPLANAALLRGTPRGFELVHNMVRDALLAFALAGARLEWHHAAVAAMLRSVPAHPARDERLAHHELDAGRPEVALEPLLSAILWRKDLGEYARAEALLFTWDRALGRAGHPPGSAQWVTGWSMRSWVCRLGDRLDEADDWATRAETAARALGDDARLGRALRLRGDVLLRRGEVVRATRVLDEAIVRLTRSGELTDVMGTTWSHAWALLLSGEHDGASAAFGRLLSVVGDAPGAEVLRAHLGWSRGNALVRAGHLDEAERVARESRERGEIGGMPLVIAHSETVLAHVALARGALDEAVTRARAALAGFDELGAGERLLPCLILGEALTRLERWDEAASVLDEGRARALRAGRALLAWPFALRRLETRLRAGDLQGFHEDLATIERDGRASGIVEPRAALLVDATLRCAAGLPEALRARVEALASLAARPAT